MLPNTFGEARHPPFGYSVENKRYRTPAQGILTNVPNSRSGRMAQIRGMQSAGTLNDRERASHYLEVSVVMSRTR